MSDAAQKDMDVDALLAWAEGRTRRWELRDGKPVMMAPERALHALAEYEAQKALETGIARVRLPCRLFPDGMTVRITARNAFEPDALVVCPSPSDFSAMEIPNPVIVVEVLSPSTVADDHGIRLGGYFSLPCVEHYLIVDADRPVLAQTRASERAIETRPARFGQVADALLEAKSHEWRNQKHREQWRIALAETAAALRARQEDEIDTEAVLAVPKPIWLDKAETASRMRGRIEAGLDYAKQRFVIWPTDRGCARD